MNSISVSWASVDPFVQLQLQSVEVAVTPECLSNGNSMHMSFVFNVTSHMENSIRIPELGICM